MSGSKVVKTVVTGALVLFLASLFSRKPTRMEAESNVQIETRPVDNLISEINVGTGKAIRNLDELDDWLAENEWVALEITFFPCSMYPFTTYYNWVDWTKLAPWNARVFFAAD